MKQPVCLLLPRGGILYFLFMHTLSSFLTQLQPTKRYQTMKPYKRTNKTITAIDKSVTNIWSLSIAILGAQIKTLKIINKGQLATFQIKPNYVWINFSTLYAPHNDDNPDFMLQSKINLDLMEGDYGIICGDFITTLDPNHVCLGYISHSHKRCRSTILSWIESDEIIDTIRCFQPLLMMNQKPKKKAELITS